MLYVGPWIRRLGYATIAQMFEALFSPIVRPIIVGVAVGACWAIVSLETQGLGAIVTIATGVPMWIGCLIGGIIGVLYVLIAGMKEVGWANLVNCILMYIAAILVLIYLGKALPGGWQGVTDFYINNDQAYLLTIFGSGDIVKAYVVGTFVSCLFYNPIVQQCAQVSCSAHNANHIKKAIIVAIPLNFMFSAIMVGLGMIAKTVPEAAAIGDGGPANLFMLVHLLPPWLHIWIIAVFMAALISTFAMLTLASAVHIVKDIMENYFLKTKLTLKQEGFYTRLIIIIFDATCIALSTLLPAVAPAIVWALSWATPMFIMFVVAMHFKRSTVACIITWIICWGMNMIMSLTPILEMVGWGGNNHALVMVILAVIFGYGLTALDKNAKPSFVSVYKSKRAEWDLTHNAAVK
jgi:SSS family solute:Na+ symporter